MLSKLIASGARASRIYDRAAELLADPEFRRRVRAVEFALWSRPVLSGDEVTEILGTRARAPVWWCRSRCSSIW
jgi:hypothetical protein